MNTDVIPDRGSLPTRFVKPGESVHTNFAQSSNGPHFASFFPFPSFGPSADASRDCLLALHGIYCQQEHVEIGLPEEIPLTHHLGAFG